MIAWVPISIFAVVLSISLWVLTPLRAKHLDPYILQWSETLLQKPGKWQKRIGRLLRQLVAPAMRLAYLFVIVWIVAALALPQIGFTLTHQAILAKAYQCKFKSLPCDSTKIQERLNDLELMPDTNRGTLVNKTFDDLIKWGFLVELFRTSEGNRSFRLTEKGEAKVRSFPKWEGL